MEKNQKGNIEAMMKRMTLDIDAMTVALTHTIDIKRPEVAALVPVLEKLSADMKAIKNNEDNVT